MSGPKRLAVLATAVWLVAWAAMYAVDPFPNWGGFLFLAVAPAGLVWGAWWVWQGFSAQ